MKKAIRLFLAGLTGLIAYLAVAQRPYALALTAKAAGQHPECPWNRLLATPWHAEHLIKLQDHYAKSIRSTASDPALGIERLESPLRPFWIKTKGADMPGPALLAYLLTEQAWIAAVGMPDVQPGDVVFDIGAHVGTFSAYALAKGASKVIMVEPDPTNIECLRRNFAEDLAAKRVVLVPAGAWSSEKTIELNVGVANSGTGSMVVKETQSAIVTVPVRPIDAMVAELGLTKVNILKMDIEGAEREALKGASETMRKYKPRLMLDAYHLPDDRTVIPQVVQAANPDYRLLCGPCAASETPSGMVLIPHSLYFQ
ncbi:MAG: FkbM family methyltransferase [Bryobacterales bacterium]|nr:FkbM family methyltransferase [Bryobacterales bacterium]